MTEPSGKLREIDWNDLCPWILLVRCVRIALFSRVLVLGAAALIAVTAGWRLVIGTGPRTLAECTAKDIVDIAKAIDTSEFRHLVRTLKNKYATDYTSRILAPTGRIEVPYLMKEMMKGF